MTTKRPQRLPRLRRLLLLRCVFGVVIAVAAVLPYTAVNFATFEQRHETTHPDDEVGIPNLSFGSRISPPKSSSTTASIAPCPCNFGPCLTWNTTSTSKCATLYPLRWYGSWDTQTCSLYQRHKRTMHFEVINLRQNGAVDDTTNHVKHETTSPACDSSSAYPKLLSYFHIFKNGGTTLRNAFQKHGLSGSLPYKTTEILFTGIQRKIGTEAFHRRLNATVQEIYKGQQQQRISKNTLQVAPFTFLREPLTRFLSGLGQVLNKYEKGKLSRSFPLSSCFANTNTSVMLDCVLEKMLVMLDDKNQQEDDPNIYPNQFVDFHLLPQAFLLRDFTGELDIGIMVTGMQEIQPILEMLLSTNTNEASNRRFHARPSRNAEYTGGHDLSSVSILTSSQQYSICRLYRMDVELLVQTNVIQDNPCAKILGIG